jgi:hypothetical protein
MRLEIYNHLGQIDLSVIDPAAVALLDDNQQQALSVLIEKTKAREAAQERYTTAVKAEGAANAEQHDALAAHIAANPPLTFQQIHAASVATFNKS